MQELDTLIQFIRHTLGQGFSYLPRQVDNEYANKLPFFVKESIKLYKANLLGHDILLAVMEENYSTTSQIERQIEIVKEVANMPVILIVKGLSAISRLRLVEKNISFIEPGKQMYLPNLLVHFNESYTKYNPRPDTLLPSAQVIVLYKLLNPNTYIERMPFKELGGMLKYSAMAITNAAENLKQLGICQIEGSKEKFIVFDWLGKQLWQHCLPLMETPVIKKVYIDELPSGIRLLKSGISALHHYTNINESRQQCLAIEKKLFYGLQNNSALVNLNNYEGRYCLEIWKYDPALLSHDHNYIDALSLYLSLEHDTDERTQMEMEEMINKYVW